MCETNQNRFACVIWVGWINWFEILNSLTFTLSLNMLCLRFLAGSHALFTRFASTKKHKSNFKTESHGIIHTFKNYFAYIVFSKKFSVFSNKQYPNTPYASFSQMRIVSIFGSPK